MIKSYSLLLIITLSMIFIISLYYKLKLDVKSLSQITLKGQIEEEPKTIGYYQDFYIQNVRVRIALKESLEIGDYIEITGSPEIRVINSLYSEKWLVYPHINEVVKYEKITKINNVFLNKFLGFRRQIIRVRKEMFGKFKRIFSNDQTGLVAGMVLGMNDSLGKDLSENMRKSGLIHIVVASGGNIAIIASFFQIFFRQFLSSRRTLVLTYLLILIYLLLAGLEPPLIRASIMIGMIWTAKIFGRKTSSLWVLLITGLVMLCFQPLQFFSLSFQLSFTATFGIVYFGEGFLSLLKMLKKQSWLVNVIGVDLSQTLAAFLMVSPLLIFSFGEINLVTILSNILVAPLIVPITLGGMVILGISYIWFPIARILGYTFGLLLDYVLAVSEILAKSNILLIRFQFRWWHIIIVWIIIIFVFEKIKIRYLKEDYE